MEKLLDLCAGVDKGLLVILVIIMGLDILTGSIGALLKKEFKSNVFREGLYKKLMEIVIVIVGYALDYVLAVEYIGKACIYLVIGMECYSVVIENAGQYIPIPEWLKNLIEGLQNKDEEERG